MATAMLFKEKFQHTDPLSHNLLPTTIDFDKAFAMIDGMIFYRICKILVSKINLKSQEKVALTKGQFSVSLF